jgi:hypothetical protein
MYIARYTLFSDPMMTNGYNQRFFLLNLPNTIACERANTNEETGANAMKKDQKNGEGITTSGGPWCRC